MTFPTGHQTIMIGEHEKWQSAREGDTYVDLVGRHWECKGTFMERPAPPPHARDIRDTVEGTGLMSGLRERLHAERTYGLTAAGEAKVSSWRAERKIPAGLPVSYETSYTKRVVDRLMQHAYGVRTGPILEAVDLLKQYHRDLSVPYEQRDDAREELRDLKRAIQSILVD